MSEQNTDREALGDIIDDWLTDPDHIDTGFLADAILASEWLSDLLREARAEAWDDAQRPRAVDVGMTNPRMVLPPNPYHRGEDA